MPHLNINGRSQQVDVDPRTPLLWVLRDAIGLTGTKYGCGIAQCGACTVHIDGVATRSCSVPVSAVGAKKVTTIEGLAANGTLHKVQQAWIDNDVPQCGYCQSGMIMAVAALLKDNPTPSDADIDSTITTLSQVNRRSFLAGAAAIGGGLSLGFRIPFGLAGAQAADSAPEVNAWVVVRPDDTVVIRIARSEMGQGTLTGLGHDAGGAGQCAEPVHNR